MRLGFLGYLVGLLVAVTASRSLQAEPMWTIGTFDDSDWEFDYDPYDDPAIVEFTIGDPVETFPAGLGTDAGPQRDIIKIEFSGLLESPSLFTFRWSPGNSSIEQFSVSLDDQFITNSEARQGQSPAVWTTDEFLLPAVPGDDHVLRLEHLSGDGTWNDALQWEIVPEPSTVASLAALSAFSLLIFGWRRRKQAK